MRMMSSDNTSYVASEDPYQRATAGWNAQDWVEPALIAMHAAHQFRSCMLEHPAMAEVTSHSSHLHNLDERRWQQYSGRFPRKSLSEVDQGAWKDRLYSRRRYANFLEEPKAQRAAHNTDYLKHAHLHDQDKHSSSQDVREIYVRSDSSLLLSRPLHVDESPGCNGSKRDSASGRYVRQISASKDPSSLVSRLLHEKNPGYNSCKEESASSQYAKEDFPGNDHSSLLLSRLLHAEIPGRNSFKEDSASTQYAREICSRNDPSLLLSRLLHEEITPGCNSFQEDSSSIQYARELCASNDPSLLLSRLLHGESPGCMTSSKKDSASNQYAKEICGSNDPSLLLSRLLHEKIPGRKEDSTDCNSSKEDSASSQYAKDICPSNDPSLLLSGLLQEETYGCNSSKEDSASNQYKKETRSSNDPSLLLSRLLNAETPDCSSSEKGSKSELYSNSKNLSVNNCSRTQLGSSSTQVASSCYSCLDQYTVFDKQHKRNNDDVNGSVKTYPFCFRSPPAVFNRTDLIEKLNGMIDKVQCESSVSERWNEKFTKVTKESTMECSEAISSCVPSQQASGIHLRNVDCAHTYLLPGAGEELVVIEDSFVIVDQDSNPRERNVKNCYQRSDQNEDFENEVGKFHEITSCDWSLNTDVGVVVKETIHDEFSGNRALMKSKATDELLDDWLIL